MAKTQVAVEITEASVRAVEMTMGKDPVIVAAGEVALPPGAAKDSEILDRDAVAMALQRLWAEYRIAERNVLLGVGNRRILVREHTTQLRHPAQIRQALPFEVQDRLPVPVDQAVLDFVPTSQDERGVHGLLVAAVSEHMEALVGALDQAKLHATSIDLVAFGYARALGHLTPAGQTGLFLGIGEHTTHIIIATDGVPRFARVVPIDIVSAAPLADPFGGALDPLDGPAPLAGLPQELPPKPVSGYAPAIRDRRRRDLREEPGAVAVEERTVTPPAEAELPLEPAVQTALIDLVARLRSTIAFYRERPDSAPIDAIWVAGVHAAHPRLVGAIAQATGVPVTPVGAFDLVPPAHSLVAHHGASMRLTSTVALLLGGPR